MADLSVFQQEDNFQTRLAAPYTAGGVTITVQTNVTFTFSQAFYISVDPGTSDYEPMKVTAISGTTWTVVGAQPRYTGDAGSAKAHAAGAKVVISNNQATFADIRTAINSKIDNDTNDTVTADTTWSTTTKAGVIVNSLTTTQRDALASSPNGAVIYNTTSGQMQWREGGAWVTNAAGGTVADASTTVAGKVEEATQAETNSGTAAGATLARLFTNPSTLAVTIQDSKWNYFADAEASDTYVITLVPAPTAYVTGQVFHFKANTANTGAATLNVNALGAKTIKKHRDQDLETGDIEANQLVTVIYDGTNFEMQSQTAQAPILKSFTDAIGDLISASAADTPAILTVGADNTSLIADSNETTGLRWGFPQQFNFDTGTWTLTETGAGSKSHNGLRVTITTGANTNDRISYTSSFCPKDTVAETNGRFLYSHLVNGDIVEATMRMDNDSTTSCDWVFGFNMDVNSLESTGVKAGFKATNGTVESSSSDGTTQEDQSPAAVTLTQMNTYKIRFLVGTSIKFYVNGTLKTTHTTRLPPVSDTQTIELGFGIKTTTTATKALYVDSFGTIRIPRSA